MREEKLKNMCVNWLTGKESGVACLFQLDLQPLGDDISTFLDKGFYF